MEKWLNDILPIMGVENDAILSKQGDVTIVFAVTLPEIFTLSNEEYEAFHQAWIKAIKILPQQTVFHKQDWYIEKKYRADFQKGDMSFLARSSERFFNGRQFLDHCCYIHLTKKPAGRKVSSSVLSNLLRKSIVPDETLDPLILQEFLDCTGQFKRILEDSGFIHLKRLKDSELMSQQKKAGVIEKYCFLSENDLPVIKDISFKEGIRVGIQTCQLYSLSNPSELPGLCGPRINYDKYSTDRTKFSVGFASHLGQLLPCNHIYNQYIFTSDQHKTIKQLESKRLRLQSLSAYSRENAIAKDATNEFLNEAIGDQRLPVKAHFNVLVWTDNPDELKDLRNLVSSGIAQMDATPKQETEGSAQIFWAGIPGNEADFPMNDTFDTFAEQATCFLSLETNYRSAQSGIRFGDRLSGRPVWLDLFDQPMRDGITSNRNLFCCGGSGGGKSMTVNHLLRSLYDQGAHCVTVDIGGSYKGLCALVGGYYFTYTESSPIRFNPFYIPAGEILDTEKKESLKALLVSLWKQENESFNRAEYVALSNAIQGYYQWLLLDRNEKEFGCFNSFYEYLRDQYVQELKQHNVKDKDFDSNNFLYVLRPYYRGGEFDYLLNAEENLDLLNQRFIVFELDNVKDHPILFPVVTLIIMELFLSKMRKLKGVRKILTIEEAWKAIAKSGMAEFIKYVFKTVRKFNGIAAVVTQEIDDLINSPIIKEAIINNADIKVLMDMRKFMNKFDALQATLGMSEKGKVQLLSVNRANEPGRSYREDYIELGGQKMMVVRNELSPEEYYAYTTEEKEKIKVQEYAKKLGGSMEKGLAALVEELQRKN